MQTRAIPFSLRQRLGYAPDSELAIEGQFDVKFITAERNRLKIPAFISSLGEALDSGFDSESDPAMGQHFGTTGS